jgi:hypothetical protein
LADTRGGLLMGYPEVETNLPVLRYQTIAECSICGAHLTIPVLAAERAFHEAGKCVR